MRQHHTLNGLVRLNSSIWIFIFYLLFQIDTVRQNSISTKMYDESTTPGIVPARISGLALAFVSAAVPFSWRPIFSLGFDTGQQQAECIQGFLKLPLLAACRFSGPPQNKLGCINGPLTSGIFGTIVDIYILVQRACGWRGLVDINGPDLALLSQFKLGLAKIMLPASQCQIHNFNHMFSQ